MGAYVQIPLKIQSSLRNVSTYSQSRRLVSFKERSTHRIASRMVLQHVDGKFYCLLAKRK